MTELSFVQRRESVWNDFSKLVKGKKSVLKKRADSFVLMFREMTQDLNTAKAYGFDPTIIDRLNILVNEGNQILYARYNWTLKEPLRFILQTFPQKVRSQRKGILAVFLLFYGISVFFCLLCIRFPGISEELLSPYQLHNIEQMYNPADESYLRPREVTSDADMFGFYIYNNISLAFQTFAGGIFAGVGSLFILCLNAGYLGIIEGHLINVGYAKTLFAFIIAHSAFELTAIIFFAYSGLLMGYRFFITGGLSRSASIRKAGQDALPIIAGSTLMLVIAAVIEAFWSSKHQFPFMIRIAAGVCVWVSALIYFLFAGRKTGAGTGNESSF